MRAVPTAIAAKLPKAADLIAERGLDQTKIEELAEVTGIPKATLYYYFAGKEEILVFLLRDLLTQVAGAVAIALESEGSGRDRLSAVVRAQFEVMADQPSVWRALIADLGRAGRMPEIAAMVADAYYTPLQQLLEEGAADGSLRAVEDAPATAMAVFGAVTVVGLHYLMSGEPLDPEALTRRISELILRGIAL
jgi:TetR/AcrR family transcriptional regulator